MIKNKQFPHFPTEGFLPKLLLGFCEFQNSTFNTGRTTRFSKNVIELEHGLAASGEYDQHYVLVEAYLKEFRIFGVDFKIKYTFKSPTKKTLTLDKQYNPIKAVWKRKYHIKNEEVTKEEYEAYLLSK